MQALPRPASSPPPRHTPSQTCWGQGKPGDPVFKAKQKHYSGAFFQKILLGENYKTFTVQCLQSQFVVNWFPKIYYNSSWLISLHSKTYFCQSSPACTRGAPTVPTHKLSGCSFIRHPAKPGDFPASLQWKIIVQVLDCHWARYIRVPPTIQREDLASSHHSYGKKKKKKKW